MKSAILIMFFKIIFELSAFSSNFTKVFIFLWARLLLYVGRAGHGIHYLSWLLIDGSVLSTCFMAACHRVQAPSSEQGRTLASTIQYEPYQYSIAGIVCMSPVACLSVYTRSVK